MAGSNRTRTLSKHLVSVFPLESVLVDLLPLASWVENPPMPDCHTCSNSKYPAQFNPDLRGGFCRSCVRLRDLCRAARSLNTLDGDTE